MAGTATRTVTDAAHTGRGRPTADGRTRVAAPAAVREIAQRRDNRGRGRKTRRRPAARTGRSPGNRSVGRPYIGRVASRRPVPSPSTRPSPSIRRGFPSARVCRPCSDSPRRRRTNNPVSPALSFNGSAAAIGTRTETEKTKTRVKHNQCSKNAFETHLKRCWNVF